MHQGGQVPLVGGVHGAGAVRAHQHLQDRGDREHRHQTRQHRRHACVAEGPEELARSGVGVEMIWFNTALE